MTTVSENAHSQHIRGFGDNMLGKLTFTLHFIHIAKIHEQPWSKVSR